VTGRSRPGAEVDADGEPLGERDAQMLARIRGLTAELEERRRQRPDKVLDDAELALIDALTGAPDASAGYRLLRSRVEQGATTWDRIWNDAYANGPAALELKLEVAHRLYGRAAVEPALERLRVLDDALEDDPDGFFREVERLRREQAGAEERAAAEEPTGRRAATLGGTPPGTTAPGPPRRTSRHPGHDDGTGAGSR
jgi:hypothetical protein